MDRARRAAYNAYINSEAWEEKRQTILRRDNWKCTKCGSFFQLRVHHLTYVRFGKELDEDLTSICDKCHRTIHNLKPLLHKKMKRLPKPPRIVILTKSERYRRFKKTRQWQDVG